MKAFWWFEENAIAGMARPGFNRTPWFEFPFEEAVLVGWLGQFSSGSTSLDAFHEHVRDYGAKILKFYNLDTRSAQQALQVFHHRAGLLGILKRLTDGPELLESYDVANGELHFRFNERRLNWEIDFLKQQGIEKIISLTESHHSKETLEEHFGAFHFSINDLDAPSFDQVQQLAEIFRDAKAKQEKVAVHCLAGIGRTSTMLMSSHILMGEKLENLKARVAKQNPSFVFAGKQAEFIQSVAERFGV